jgi:hypothetical protein
MRAEELSYWEQRAEEQIRLAQRASDTRVVQAHYELASAYLEMIFGLGEDGTPPRAKAFR